MTTMTTRTHPVLAAVEVIEDCLEAVSEVNPIYMTTPVKAQALIRLGALAPRLDELRLRLLASAGDVAEETAARDAAAWLARQCGLRPETTRADARLGAALEGRGLLAAAMREGAASRDQAEVIVRALDKLPAQVDEDLTRQAEEMLVGFCAELTPAELAQAGKHILEHLAPEIAEEALRRQLEDEEKTAQEKQRLRLQRLGDGTTRIGGVLPDAAATRLAQALQAFANPRKAATGETPDDQDAALKAFMKLPYPRRLAEAFCGLMESLDPDRLPIHGGDATSLVVTIGLEDLRSGLVGARIHAGALPGDDSAATVDHLSPGETRRLACTARIIPAVLGGSSEILDLGRARRLFTAAQRKALLIRDQTCRARGCDIPGTWAEAHHWVPWGEDGPTDLANGVLLCRHHHLRAHDPVYVVQRLPNGDVRYARRT